MTRPEVDVTIEATASPAVEASGATSDVSDAAVIGEVVGSSEEEEAEVFKRVLSDDHYQ